MEKKIDRTIFACELTSADMLEKTKSENKSLDKSVNKSDDKSFNKPKKMRCHLCNKKLKMIHFTCKCEFTFCILHHNPHQHNCQFDAIKEKKQFIINNNPKLNSKFIKI